MMEEPTEVLHLSKRVQVGRRRKVAACRILRVLDPWWSLGLPLVAR